MSASPNPRSERGRKAAADRWANTPPADAVITHLVKIAPRLTDAQRALIRGAFCDDLGDVA